ALGLARGALAPPGRTRGADRDPRGPVEHRRDGALRRELPRLRRGERSSRAHRRGRGAADRGRLGPDRRQGMALRRGRQPRTRRAPPGRARPALGPHARPDPRQLRHAVHHRNLGPSGLHRRARTGGLLGTQAQCLVPDGTRAAASSHGDGARRRGLHHAPCPVGADRHHGASRHRLGLCDLPAAELRPGPRRERPDSGRPCSLESAARRRASLADPPSASRGRLMRRLLLALLFWLAALPLTARAQEAATLVADRVFLTADDRLTAEGAVEVFYKGARLTARRIVYDGATEELAIGGPITLTDGAGMVILADQAELSRDLTEGVLRSARMVLDEQLQIAADEIARSSGRFTRASRVVAASCQVCPSNSTPLWEIRARSVLHDQTERQLYFDHAQFRIAGIPVFYVPRLRMPDPTLKRATGFLMPRFRTTTALGPGLKLPYFIAIGDSRDLTLTPYLSASRTRTLEFRYREVLRSGTIEVNGAVTRDDLL